MIRAGQLNAMHTAVGPAHKPTAWIAKGKPTGNQSVMMVVVVKGVTIQPKIKNKRPAMMSFFIVGKRKAFLDNDFMIVFPWDWVDTY